VLASKGAIATGNNYPNQAVISTAKEIRRDLPLNFFMERYAESFAEELRCFIQSVTEDKPTLVTGEDARYSVLMGMAALKSHEQGRPVKVEEVAAVAAR
jgi:myo-inositol 2-dehydrogenase/D-chiro-inositol 1-dehydrogenase